MTTIIALSCVCVFFVLFFFMDVYKEERSRLPSPQLCFPALPKASRDIFRPDELYSLCSRFWVPYKLEVPGRPPMVDAQERRHPDEMPKAP